MHRILILLVTSLALTCSAFCTALHAENASHIGRHQSTSEEVQAINQVLLDFQSALLNKDIKQLSSLMLNSNILFASPSGQPTITRVREKLDVNYDGLSTGGYTNFAQFIAGSKKRIQEKFYNVNITQDDNVAWASFDFEFLVDEQVQNYGVESWQLMKTDGKWKIFSVVWSSHESPK